ncbi:response regulator transcription factor [Niabella drilacis]|uniref:Response regulator receiver domain-containing protein n=1 Tax=Niabella drilacis (strain DSM 25811 / CCM 8410 / CCUG 62505 / LMG 26954 / E90) TaxID=1285928 RepID=A0A1G6Z1U9_NIADE|nr:response regulator [Niabella drilacis]SDD96578.1 Response regulator receiver domain-containing protein [Niabella drilacis]
MKILLVEDATALLRAIELKLKKIGYDVHPCSDGRQALQELDAFAPDLIITDIMLPFVSGLEVLNAAKAKSKKIPVIVFSAMGQENAVEEAFLLGADDYVVKPFGLKELEMRIKRVMGTINADANS